MINFTDKFMDLWALLFIMIGIVGLFVIPFWHDAVIPVTIAFMFGAFISRNTIDQTRKSIAPLLNITVRAGDLYVEADELSLAMIEKFGEVLKVFEPSNAQEATLIPIILELAELTKKGVAIHKKADELSEYAEQYSDLLSSQGH